MSIKASITKLNVLVLNCLNNMNFNLIIILAIFKLSASLNTDFVQDYLINLKNVQNSILFTCVDIQSLKYLANNLSESTVSFNFYNPSEELINLPKILNRRLIAKCGVVLDTNCKGYKNVLHQASYFRFFNRTYHWLIIDDEEKDIFNLNLTQIEIGSQITYAKKIMLSYKLIDVYSKAPHLGSPLTFKEYGFWDNEFNITNNLYPIFNKENRGNFNGLTLRGATIIDKDNVNQKDVDDLLTSTEMSVGISQSTKYHYALTKLLNEHFNFNIKYQVLRTWDGLLPSGYRLGVFGLALRNETDIVAAGFWKRIERHDVMDNFHHSWFFE